MSEGLFTSVRESKLKYLFSQITNYFFSILILRDMYSRDRLGQWAGSTSLETVFAGPATAIRDGEVLTATVDDEHRAD